MATGTTWQLIRRGLLGSICRSNTPNVLGQHRWERPNLRREFRLWALTQAGGHIFRALDLRSWSTTDAEPQTFDPEAYMRTDSATLVIAYPTDVGLYDVNDADADMDNFEDVIEADSNQLRDILRSADGNLVTGLHEVTPIGRTTEQDSEAVWFHVLQLRVTYTCIQHLF